MRIALASFDQRWEDKPANVVQCRTFAMRAAELDAELIVFPEMTLTGFTMNATSVAESPQHAASIAVFADIARAARVAVAFGIVLHGEGRPQNCLVVLGPDGAELSRYTKIHPFSHAREDEHYEAGNSIATAAINDVVFGLTICYDLRFPELYAALAPSCNALLVIANWPDKRIAHWHALLIARAIESQCYVVGVNRTGVDGNGIVYPRSSVVIDPAGAVVEPDVVRGVLDVFTLDARAVEAYRRAFPTLQDRKPELYSSLGAQRTRSTPARLSISG